MSEMFNVLKEDLSEQIKYFIDKVLNWVKQEDTVYEWSLGKELENMKRKHAETRHEKFHGKHARELDKCEDKVSENQMDIADHQLIDTLEVTRRYASWIWQLL